MGCQGWAPVSVPFRATVTIRSGSNPLLLSRFTQTRLFSTPPPSPSEENANDSKDKMDSRTSFDQAGASLIEEEDRKRLEQMGDFDDNKSVCFV
jgi:hypothetical protein